MKKRPEHPAVEKWGPRLLPRPADTARVLREARLDTGERLRGLDTDQILTRIGEAKRRLRRS